MRRCKRAEKRTVVGWGSWSVCGSRERRQRKSRRKQINQHNGGDKDRAQHAPLRLGCCRRRFRTCAMATCRGAQSGTPPPRRA
eukprot:993710-Rhodomonas_salina.1